MTFGLEYNFKMLKAFVYLSVLSEIELVNKMNHHT